MIASLRKPLAYARGSGKVLNHGYLFSSTRRSAETPRVSLRSLRNDTKTNNAKAGIGGMATASTLIVFWIVRIEASMSARAFSICRCFFVLDVRARHLQSAVLDVLLIGDHDALGLLVEIGSLAQLLNRAVETRLRFFQAVFGHGLGFLGVLEPAVFVDFGSGFDGFQRAVLAAALAESDERLIPGELVDSVEQERNVVEIQVLDASPAQLEELFAHHVDIGDDNRVDRVFPPISP